MEEARAHMFGLPDQPAATTPATAAPAEGAPVAPATTPSPTTPVTPPAVEAPKDSAKDAPPAVAAEEPLAILDFLIPEAPDPLDAMLGQKEPAAPARGGVPARGTPEFEAKHKEALELAASTDPEIAEIGARKLNRLLGIGEAPAAPEAAPAKPNAAPANEPAAFDEAAVRQNVTQTILTELYLEHRQEMVDETGRPLMDPDRPGQRLMETPRQVIDRLRKQDAFFKKHLGEQVEKEVARQANAHKATIEQANRKASIETRARAADAAIEKASGSLLLSMALGELVGQIPGVKRENGKLFAPPAVMKSVAEALQSSGAHRFVESVVTDPSVEGHSEFDSEMHRICATPGSSEEIAKRVAQLFCSRATKVKPHFSLLLDGVAARVKAKHSAAGSTPAASKPDAVAEAIAATKLGAPPSPLASSGAPPQNGTGESPAEAMRKYPVFDPRHQAAAAQMAAALRPQ